MKVWLYYRLSRDEDAELNSLTNQKNILVEYAKSNGHEIIGESFDDNVSGMHFNREGINKIYEQVEQNNIEAIIVKDMSRLGRHKTQTALFIDYLREHDVRVLSVTENLDTSNEDDDLIIGFKGLFNDMYARDISKKVRAGMVQKQKKGFVMIPPLGYFKDKNTNQVVVVEEHAQIVRRIFDMYLEGYGFSAIARIFNEEGIKSPAYYQKQLLGKSLGYNKSDQKEILLERIRDKEHAAVYDEMLIACENDIKKISGELYDIQNYSETIKKRKSEMKQTVDLIEEIVKEGQISNANLRQLIDKIIICEDGEGLRIQINLNAAFTEHMTIFSDDGQKLADLKVIEEGNYPLAMRRRMRFKE